ncbi:MAG: YcaO-like family protein [Bryobacteraceae bacterium]|nr:YcaO-like family protein [Bryobacteraceae bacterium]
MSTVPPGFEGRLSELSTSRRNGFFVTAAELTLPRSEPSRPVSKVFVSGQSRNEETARRSCLAEAAERYSITFQGDEPRFAASYSQLGEQAIHPRDLLQFSEAQYRRRKDAETSAWRFPYVPVRYEDDVEIEWTPVSDLLGDGFRVIPMQYCYAGYGPLDRRTLCVPDSNGCAAGETFEAAVVRGFLELVERDATAMWWYNRVRRPALDPRALGWAEMADHVEAHAEGRSTTLLDLTSDLGIAVCVAIGADEAGGDLTLGFGAAFGLERAAWKALAELAQITSAWAGAEPGEFRRYSQGACFQYWRSVATLESEAHLRPDPDARAAAVEIPAGDEYGHCLAIARRKGLRLFAAVLTRPEVAMPVVRVLTPDLCCPWHRLGFQRLYEVPVSLGWRPRVLAEEELNPAPFCL